MNPLQQDLRAKGPGYPYDDRIAAGRMDLDFSPENLTVSSPGALPQLVSDRPLALRSFQGGKRRSIQGSRGGDQEQADEVEEGGKAGEVEAGEEVEVEFG
jgi:hypothetical protein